MRLLIVGLSLGLLAAFPTLATAQTPVPVTVQGERAGPLVLHHVLVEGRRSRWTGRYNDASRPVCSAPCQVTIPSGLYRFAVSDGEHDPRRVGRLTSIDGPLSLSIDYESRGGLRAAGWAIFGGGAIVGAIITLVGALMLGDNAQEDLSYGLMIGGLSTIATGGLISIPMVAMQDHASVRVLGRSLVASRW